MGIAIAKKNWMEDSAVKGAIAAGRPNESFWQAWRHNKEELKAAGISVKKANDSWVVKAPKPIKLEEFEGALPEMKRPLWRYQADAVRAIAVRRFKCLLGYEMGTGKSFIALAAFVLARREGVCAEAVVVCPAHLRANWRKEIAKFLPDGNPIEIFSYEKFKELPARAFLIVDESHYIKNHKAQRSKKVVQAAKRAAGVLCLSGTPAVNRPVELWNQLDAIGAAGAIATDWWSFTKRFCAGHQTKYGYDCGGASNVEELHEMLFGARGPAIRKRKDEVLGDLPPKLRSDLPLEVDLREYRQQINSYPIEPWSPARHLQMIEAAKQACARAKLPLIIKMLKEEIESGDAVPTLLFGVHREIVQAVADELGCPFVMGGQSEGERASAVDAFMDGASEFLALNIQAGGTGLNLQRAQRVIFLEYPWTPGELVQAEDRCHRAGVQHSVQVVMPVAEKTIDQQLVSLLASKAEVLASIMDGSEVSNSKESIAKALHEALTKERKTKKSA